MHLKHHENGSASNQRKSDALFSRLAMDVFCTFMSRLDRFTFMPGDLKEVTDPAVLAEINRKYGDISMAPEEQRWVSTEGKNDGQLVTMYRLTSFGRNTRDAKRWVHSDCVLQRNVLRRKNALRFYSFEPLEYQRFRRFWRNAFRRLIFAGGYRPCTRGCRRGHTRGPRPYLCPMFSASNEPTSV